jgi:hypothetical protein
MYMSIVSFDGGERDQDTLSKSSRGPVAVPATIADFFYLKLVLK